MHVPCTALPHASQLRGVTPLRQALLAADHPVSVAVPGFAQRHLAPYGFLVLPDTHTADSDVVHLIGPRAVNGCPPGG
jgi:hypothetical protein